MRSRKYPRETRSRQHGKDKRYANINRKRVTEISRIYLAKNDYFLRLREELLKNRNKETQRAYWKLAAPKSIKTGQTTVPQPKKPEGEWKPPNLVDRHPEVIAVNSEKMIEIDLSNEEDAAGFYQTNRPTAWRATRFKSTKGMGPNARGPQGEYYLQGINYGVFMYRVAKLRAKGDIKAAKQLPGGVSRVGGMPLVATYMHGTPAYSRTSSDDIPKNLTALDVPKKPIALDVPKKPIALDVPKKPIALDVPKKPIAFDVPKNPTALDIPKKPTALDVPKKPTALDVPKKPTALDVPKKPTALTKIPRSEDNIWKRPVDASCQTDDVILRQLPVSMASPSSVAEAEPGVRGHVTGLPVCRLLPMKWVKLSPEGPGASGESSCIRVLAKPPKKKQMMAAQAQKLEDCTGTVASRTSSEILVGEKDEMERAGKLHTALLCPHRMKAESCTVCRQLSEKSKTTALSPETRIAVPQSARNKERNNAWCLYISLDDQGTEKPKSGGETRKALTFPTEEAKAVKREDIAKNAWNVHCSQHVGRKPAPDSCVYCKQLLGKQKPPNVPSQMPEIAVRETLPVKENEQEKQEVSENPQQKPRLSVIETLPDEEDKEKSAWHRHRSYHFDGNEKPDSCIFCWQQVEPLKTSDTVNIEPESLLQMALSEKDDDIKIAWYLHRFLHVEDNCVHCKGSAEKQLISGGPPEKSEAVALKATPCEDDEKENTRQSHNSLQVEASQKPDWCIFCWKQDAKSKKSESNIEEAESEATKKTLPEMDEEMEIACCMHKRLHVDDNGKSDSCIYCKHFAEQPQAGEESENVCSKSLPNKEVEAEAAWDLHSALHVLGNAQPDRCIFCRHLVEKPNTSETITTETEPVTTNTLTQNEDEIKLFWLFHRVLQALNLHNAFHLDGNQKPDICFYCRQQTPSERNETAKYVHDSCHLEGNQYPDSCIYCRELLDKRTVSDVILEERDLCCTELLDKRRVSDAVLEYRELCFINRLDQQRVSDVILDERELCFKKLFDKQTVSDVILEEGELCCKKLFDKQRVSGVVLEERQLTVPDALKGKHLEKSTVHSKNIGHTSQIGLDEEEKEKTAWYLHCAYHFDGNENPDSCIFCWQQTEQIKPESEARKTLSKPAADIEIAWNLHRFLHVGEKWKPDSCIYCKLQQTPDLSAKQAEDETPKELSGKDGDKKNTFSSLDIVYSKRSRKLPWCTFCWQAAETSEVDIELPESEAQPDEKDEERNIALHVHRFLHDEDNWKTDSCIYCKHFAGQPQASYSSPMKPKVVISKAPSNQQEEKVKALNLHRSLHVPDNLKPDRCIFCRQLSENEKTLEIFTEETVSLSAISSDQEDNEMKLAWYFHQLLHMQDNWNPGRCSYCRQPSQVQHTSDGSPEVPEPITTLSPPDKENENENEWKVHRSYHLDGNPKPDSCSYCRQENPSHVVIKKLELPASERLHGKEEKAAAKYVHDSCHLDGSQYPDSCIYCKDLFDKQRLTGVILEERELSCGKLLGKQRVSGVSLEERELYCKKQVDKQNVTGVILEEGELYYGLDKQRVQDVILEESELTVTNTPNGEGEEKSAVHSHVKDHKRPNRCIRCGKMLENPNKIEISPQEAQITAAEHDKEKTAWNLHRAFHFDGNEKPDSCIFCWQQSQQLNPSETSQEEPESAAKKTLSEPADDIKIAWNLHRFLHVEDTWKPDSCMHCKSQQTPVGPVKPPESVTTKALSGKDGDKENIRTSPDTLHVKGSRKPPWCKFCLQAAERSESDIELPESEAQADPDEKDEERNIALHVHKLLHDENNLKTDNCIYCKHFAEQPQAPDSSSIKPETVFLNTPPNRQEETEKALNLHRSLHVPDKSEPDRCIFCRQSAENEKTLEICTEETVSLTVLSLIQDDDDKKLAWYFHRVLHVQHNCSPDHCSYCRQQNPSQDVIKEPELPASERPRDKEEIAAKYVHDSCHLKGTQHPDSCIYCKDLLDQERLTGVILEERELCFKKQLDKQKVSGIILEESQLYCRDRLDKQKVSGICLEERDICCRKLFDKQKLSGVILDEGELFCRDPLAKQSVSDASLEERELTVTDAPNAENIEKSAVHSHDKDNQKPDICIRCGKMLKNPNKTEFSPQEVQITANEEDVTVTDAPKGEHLEKSTVHSQHLVHTTEISPEEAQITAIEIGLDEEDKEKTAWYLHCAYHFDGNENPDSCIFCWQQREQLKPESEARKTLSEPADDLKLDWNLHRLLHIEDKGKPDSCLHCKPQQIPHGPAKPPEAVTTKALPLKNTGTSHDTVRVKSFWKPLWCKFCWQAAATPERSLSDIELPEPEAQPDEKDEKNVGLHVHRFLHDDSNWKTDNCIYCKHFAEQPQTSDSSSIKPETFFSNTPSNQQKEKEKALNLHRSLHVPDNPEPGRCIFCKQLAENHPTLENCPEESVSLTAISSIQNDDERKLAFYFHRLMHDQDNWSPGHCIYCRKLDEVQHISNIPETVTTPAQPDEAENTWYVYNSYHSDPNEKPDTYIYCKEPHPLEVITEEPELSTTETLTVKEDKSEADKHVHESCHLEGNQYSDSCIYCKDRIDKPRVSDVVLQERELCCKDLIDKPRVSDVVLQERELCCKDRLALQRVSDVVLEERELMVPDALNKEKHVKSILQSQNKDKRKPSILKTTEVSSNEEDREKTAWYLHCDYHFDDNEKPDSCIFCCQQRKQLKPSETSQEEPESQTNKPLFEFADDIEIAWNLHRFLHVEDKWKRDGCIYCKPQQKSYGPAKHAEAVTTKTLLGKDGDKENIRTSHDALRFKGSPKSPRCTLCWQEPEKSELSENVSERSESEAQSDEKDEERNIALHVHRFLHDEDNWKTDNCIYCKHFAEQHQASYISPIKPETVCSKAPPNQQEEKVKALNLHRSLHVPDNPKPDRCIFDREVAENETTSEISSEVTVSVTTISSVQNDNEMKRAWYFHRLLHVQDIWNTGHCIYCRQPNEVQHTSDVPETLTTISPSDKENEMENEWQVHSSLHLDGNPKPASCIHCVQLAEQHTAPEILQEGPEIFSTELFSDARASNMSFSTPAEEYQKSYRCLYCKQPIEGHQMSSGQLVWQDEPGKKQTHSGAYLKEKNQTTIECFKTEDANEIGIICQSCRLIGRDRESWQPTSGMDPSGVDDEQQTTTPQTQEVSSEKPAIMAAQSLPEDNQYYFLCKDCMEVANKHSPDSDQLALKELSKAAGEGDDDWQIPSALPTAADAAKEKKKAWSLDEPLESDGELYVLCSCCKRRLPYQPTSMVDKTPVLQFPIAVNNDDLALSIHLYLHFQDKLATLVKIQQFEQVPREDEGAFDKSQQLRQEDQAFIEMTPVEPFSVNETSQAVCVLTGASDSLGDHAFIEMTPVEPMSDISQPEVGQIECTLAPEADDGEILTTPKEKDREMTWNLRSPRHHHAPASAIYCKHLLQKLPASELMTEETPPGTTKTRLVAVIEDQKCDICTKSRLEKPWPLYIDVNVNESEKPNSLSLVENSQIAQVPLQKEKNGKKKAYSVLSIFPEECNQARYLSGSCKEPLENRQLPDCLDLDVPCEEKAVPNIFNINSRRVSIHIWQNERKEAVQHSDKCFQIDEDAYGIGQTCEERPKIVKEAPVEEPFFNVDVSKSKCVQTGDSLVTIFSDKIAQTDFSDDETKGVQTGDSLVTLFSSDGAQADFSDDETKGVQTGDSLVTLFSSDGAQTDFSDDETKGVQTGDSLVTLFSSDGAQTDFSDDETKGVQTGESLVTLFSSDRAQTDFSDDETKEVQTGDSLVTLFSSDGAQTDFSDDETKGVQTGDSLVTLFSSERKPSILKTTEVSSNEEDREKTAWYLHCDYHFDGNEKPDSCIFCWQQRKQLKPSETSQEEPESQTNKPHFEFADDIEIAWNLHRFLHVEDKWKRDGCIYCKPQQKSYGPAKQAEAVTTKTLLGKDGDKENTQTSHEALRFKGSPKPLWCKLCWQAPEKSELSESVSERSESEAQPDEKDEERNIALHVHRFLHHEDNWKTDNCIYCKHFAEQSQAPDSSSIKLETVFLNTPPNRQEETEKALNLHRSLHVPDNPKPDRCIFCRVLAENETTSEISSDVTVSVTTISSVQNDNEMKLAWYFHRLLHVQDIWNTGHCIYCRQPNEVQHTSDVPETLTTISPSDKENEMENEWQVHSSLHLDGNPKPASCIHCVQLAEQHTAPEILQEGPEIFSTELFSDARASNMSFSTPAEEYQKSYRRLYCKQPIEGHQMSPGQLGWQDEPGKKQSHSGAYLKHKDQTPIECFKTEDANEIGIICQSCRDRESWQPTSGMDPSGVDDEQQTTTPQTQEVSSEKPAIMAAQILPEERLLPAKDNQYYFLCKDCMEVANKHSPDSDQLALKELSKAAGEGDDDWQSPSALATAADAAKEKKKAWSLDEPLESDGELYVLCSCCKRRLPYQPTSMVDKSPVLQFPIAVNNDDLALSIHLYLHFQDKLATLVKIQQFGQVPREDEGAFDKSQQMRQEDQAFVEMTPVEPFSVNETSQAVCVLTGGSDSLDDHAFIEMTPVEPMSDISQPEVGQIEYTVAPEADDGQMLTTPKQKDREMTWNLRNPRHHHVPASAIYCKHLLQKLPASELMTEETPPGTTKTRLVAVIEDQKCDICTKNRLEKPWPLYIDVDVNESEKPNSLSLVENSQIAQVPLQKEKNGKKKAYSVLSIFPEECNQARYLCGSCKEPLENRQLPDCLDLDVPCEEKAVPNICNINSRRVSIHIWQNERKEAVQHSDKCFQIDEDAYEICQTCEERPKIVNEAPVEEPFFNVDVSKSKCVQTGDSLVTIFSDKIAQTDFSDDETKGVQTGDSLVTLFSSDGAQTDFSYDQIDSPDRTSLAGTDFSTQRYYLL